MKKLWIPLCVFLFASSSAVFAGTEITGIVGGLIGGDLNAVVESGNFSLSRSFSNAPLYGVRLGYDIPFLQLEGGFVASPHGLSLQVENLPVTVDASVYYAEANVLFVPIPGFISPFVTAGIGLHHFNFALSVTDIGALDTSFTKTGYNFGAGLKIRFSQLVVRGEIRDHVTKIGPEDFGAGDIANQLGFSVDQKLHNVEISVGAGIRF